MQSGFVFENPHAKKSCGCGTRSRPDGFLRGAGPGPEALARPGRPEEAVLRTQPAMASRPFQPLASQQEQQRALDMTALDQRRFPHASRSHHAGGVFSQRARDRVIQRRAARIARRSVRAEHGAGRTARRRRFRTRPTRRSPSSIFAAMRDEIDRVSRPVYSRHYDAAPGGGHARRDPQPRSIGGAIFQTWLGKSKRN